MTLYQASLINTKKSTGLEIERRMAISLHAQLLENLEFLDSDNGIPQEVVGLWTVPTAFRTEPWTRH